MPSKHNTNTQDDIALSGTNSSINDAAVKKTSRILKSVIKLDKNPYIYIHGDRKLIQQGQDENGKYYIIFRRRELKNISADLANLADFKKIFISIISLEFENKQDKNSTFLSF